MAEYLGYFVTRERRTDHASAANMFWSVIFLSKPYTSFWLIDCLLQKAKLSYDDLLKDHNILKKTFRKGDIVADPRETSIISPLPGKCTSFAIQVVEKLEKTYKNIYDFQFYRLGPHTVARCQKTGVLIDSSSSGGAITLNDGPWETFNNRDNWAWNPQENRFEKSRPESPEYKEYSTPLSRDQCMAIVLSRIAADPQPLCYFRDSEWDVKNGARFFGMIKWHLKEKRMQLSEVYKSTDAANIVVNIVWDGKGDAETEAHCLEGIEQFVAFLGGSRGQSGLEQWKTCKGPHERLWAAAKREWGYPRALDKEERPAKKG